MTESATVSCVVCGARLAASDAHWSNPWEKVRKQAPCCSPACAARYDPDEHWVPATRPAPSPVPAGDALSQAFRRRMMRGDAPRTIVRERLLEGIPSDALRAVVFEIRDGFVAHTEAQQRRAVRKSALSAIFGGVKLLLGGSASISVYDELPDFDTSRLDDALADLDRWDRAGP